MSGDDKVQRMAAEVASGIGWTLAEEYKHCAVIRNDEGECLRFTNALGARVKIEGYRWPKTIDGRNMTPSLSPSIFVSINRPSVEVASDVLKRLMPRYRQALDEARAQKAERDELVRPVIQALEETGDGFGEKLSDGDLDVTVKRGINSVTDTKDCTADFSTMFDGLCDIRIDDADEEVVRAVAAALVEVKRKHEPKGIGSSEA